MVPDPHAPPPFLAAVRALYDAFDAFDAAAAARLGLHRTDLTALTLLEHGPRRAGDLGGALGLSSGAVTALIDRLERAGHVERKPDAADRRAVLVSLTGAAREAIGAVYRRSFAAVWGAVAESEAGELKAASRLVERAAAACSAEASELRGAARPE